MYLPTDLKKGALIDIDGKPHQVIEYAQKVMGRGGSIVNVKLKNLVDGNVIPKTYKGQEKIEPAEVDNQTVSFLYKDQEKAYFMNQQTFAQFELMLDVIGDQVYFLKEGEEYSLQFYQERVINLMLPKNMFLKVVYTEDVVKGDTTSSVLKDAELETGLTVKVPAFIKTGDQISVDTETKAYRERKK